LDSSYAMSDRCEESKSVLRFVHDGPLIGLSYTLAVIKPVRQTALTPQREMRKQGNALSTLVLSVRFSSLPHSHCGAGTGHGQHRLIGEK